MFKKKANNTKKVDLCQETEQITIELPPQQNIPNQPQPILEEQISNATKIHITKLKIKNNLFTLQAFEKNQTSQTVKPNENAVSREEQRQVNSQIEQCFSEFRKLKQKEVQLEQKVPMIPQQNNKPKVIENAYFPGQSDSQQQQQQQWLSYEEDKSGGFSPVFGYGKAEDYDENEGDYEDELIRKTLTKRNYDNLANNGGTSLKRMKQNDATDNFIKRLKKVNAESIKKAISRDLYNKKQKLKELNEGLQELTSHGGNKKNEIEKKQKRLKGLKQQQQQLNKVIEYIYYWGDKIKDVSMGAILKKMREQQQRKGRYSQDEEGA